MGLGLYVHIPFCKSKCAYCDFYSLPMDEKTFDRYLDALLREAAKLEPRKCDTLYLGGGTPTVLGAQRIYKLVSILNEKFGPFSEATIEANPADDLYETLLSARKAGINRVSFGAQSSNENELRLLSRRHGVEDIKKAVDSARRAGISNISLDLMLGIPEQTEKSLLSSLDFLLNLEPTHISAYMLSLEEGTPLYNNRKDFSLPSQEETAELYLLAAKTLAARGFIHYEISNWAKEGFESEHNLNYWRQGEYIALGAAAHGFLDGGRYYYENDIEKFTTAPEPIECDLGGGEEEYLMLALRLSEGIIFSEYEKKFGGKPEKLIKNARPFIPSGHIILDENHLALTSEGFLLFNEIFLKLTDY